MPKPSAQAVPSNKPRLRQRHGRSTDQMLLEFYDRLLASVDKAELQILQASHHYPPALLADLLTRADEARRELQTQRLDILAKPRPVLTPTTPRR